MFVVLVDGGFSADSVMMILSSLQFVYNVVGSLTFDHIKWSFVLVLWRILKYSYCPRWLI